MARMPASVYTYIFRKSRNQQAVVIAITLALLPLAPVPLELQRRMLDEAVANRDFDLLIWLGMLYVGALLLSSGLKFLMRYQRELISASIVRALRKSVYFFIYTAAPDPVFDEKGNRIDEVDEGAVVSMMSSEVEKLGAFAGSAISGPLFEVGTLTVILGYMFWVEPTVAAIALLLYSPQLFIVPYFQARMNNLAMEKALKVREMGTFITENPEETLLRQKAPAVFLDIVEGILSIRQRYILTKNIMKTLNNLLIAMGPFGVVAYGGYLVIQGELEVGVILAFVSGLERLGGPIRDLIGSYSAITDARMRYATLVSAFPEDMDDDAK